MALMLVQPSLWIVVLVLVLCGLLAMRLARQIVRPINAINPDNPNATPTYPELQPLITRLQEQNRTIRTQLSELSTRQREFDAITENMREGFLIVDNKCSILSSNRSALRLLGIRDVIEVSSGVKTGLNIRSEQPRQVGSDRVAAAVAARAKGKLPCVAITLGTATTFTALDGSGALVGSAITAGVQLSLLALREQAAQLPAVAIDAKDEGILARNTVDAMRVGAVYGAASLVDGMVERFAEALGETPYVVLTGELAPLVTPYLRIPFEYDESLVLDGLHLIWKKNRG